MKVLKHTDRHAVHCLVSCRMATAANMRMDQKTIDQVLAAIRRNPTGTAGLASGAQARESAVDKARRERDEKRARLTANRTSPGSTSGSSPSSRTTTTSRTSSRTATRTSSRTGSSSKRLSRPYRAELSVDGWVGVARKPQPARPQPARLKSDNGNGSWEVEFANSGGSATVKEGVMKPLTSHQKATVDRL